MTTLEQLLADTAPAPVNRHGMSCTLYTLDGIKPATATRRNDTTYFIRATDGSAAIIVNAQKVESRYAEEKTPLFYAC